MGLVESAAEGLVASAGTAVLPFHLDQPVMAAKSLVELGAIAGCRSGAKPEVAFIGIFLATGIKPGIQIRIGNRFFGLVGKHVDNAVTAGISIGAGGLGFAAGRADHQ